MSDKYLEKLYKEKTNRSNIFSDDGCLIKSIHFHVQTNVLSNSKLKQYFRQFGEYISCVPRKKGTFIQGYVNYKYASDAGAVLKSRHFCGGFEIKVSKCHSWNQLNLDPDMVAKSIVATSNFRLLELDDDCLFHILSRLQLTDLTSVYSTSKRLQAIAKNVFCVQYTTIDLDKKNRLTPVQLHEVFVCFGKHILELKVAAMNFNEELRCAILRLVFKYCLNLRSLNLTGFKFTTQISLRNNEMLKQLRNLQLCMCKFDQKIKLILLQCQKLRTLSIQLPINVLSSDLSFRVLSLESVELITDEIQPFYSFFQKNIQLKHIKIVSSQIGTEVELKKYVKEEIIDIKQSCIGFQKLINQ